MSPDAALEVAQRLAVTVFIDSGESRRPKAIGSSVTPLPEAVR